LLPNLGVKSIAPLGLLMAIFSATKSYKTLLFPIIIAISGSVVVGGLVLLSKNY